jgi:hypothetical protein
MKNILIKLCSLLLVLSIAGCVPYYKLSKKEFHQGTDLQTHKDVAKEFVRSQTVYDQFTTLANFDAIWLSDQTRIAYVDLFCEKRGKSKDARAALLNRQLEENRHWISFYVLADVREDFNSALNDENPVWTPYLEIDGEKFEPITIKEIDLEPEYSSFFENRLNSFKTAYLVSFPAQDLSGKFYLSGCKILRLVMCSADKLCNLEWNIGELDKKIDQKKSSKKEFDFYWGK